MKMTLSSSGSDFYLYFLFFFSILLSISAAKGSSLSLFWSPPLSFAQLSESFAAVFLLKSVLMMVMKIFYKKNCGVLLIKLPYFC